MSKIILTQEEVENLYKQLTIGHKLAVIMSRGDMPAYTQMLTTAITKSVGSLGTSKLEHPFFDNELFKKELTEGLHECLENKELVAEYGELWLAEDNTLVEILEAIAEAMMTSLLSQMKEEMQAKFN